VLNKFSYIKEGISIEGGWEKVPRISVLKIQNTATELKKMPNKREIVKSFFFTNTNNVIKVGKVIRMVRM